MSFDDHTTERRSGGFGSTDIYYYIFSVFLNKCLFLNCLVSMVKDKKKSPWLEMWSNRLGLRFTSSQKAKLILLKSWNFWILFLCVTLFLDIRNFPPVLIILFYLKNQFYFFFFSRKKRIRKKNGQICNFRF